MSAGADSSEYQSSCGYRYRYLLPAPELRLRVASCREPRCEAQHGFVAIAFTWTGACSAADRAKLESFVSRCKRLEYCSSEVPTYSDLTVEADDTLFSRIMANHGHVLQPLLPNHHSIPTVRENDRIIRHYIEQKHTS